MHGPLTRIACAALFTTLAAAAAGAQTPNVVFLLADDFGWTDLSTGRSNRGNGSDYYRTPNIDRLASMGVSFDNAYSSGPNCTPTRAALMSGQYAARTGIYTVNLSNRGAPKFRMLDGAPNRLNLNPGVTSIWRARAVWHG